MKLTNRFITSVPLPSSWQKTPDGFLRTPARVLAQRIMPYAREELSEIPECCTADPIMMLVTVDEMASPEALRSLEGAAVVVGEHNWVTPETHATFSRGNVAGSPRIDGEYTACDLLITNPDAIADIEAKKYPEISSAYLADTVFEPGVFEGTRYDAIQTNLRYNHIAVIPQGMGRAGEDVRIMNNSLAYKEGYEAGLNYTKDIWENPYNSDPEQKQWEQGYNKGHKEGVSKMGRGYRRLKNSEGGKSMEIVKVRLRNGKIINTDEAGAEAIAEDQKATELGTGDLGKKIEELEGKIAEAEAIQAECEELKGELSVYKAKLDELLSADPVDVDGAAEEMIEEAAEADEIIENAIGPAKDEEQEKAIVSLLKAENGKRLRGEALHRAVLGICNVKHEGLSADAVKGAFKTLGQMVRNTGGAKKVAGASMFQNTQKQVDAPQLKQGLDRLNLGKKA